MNVYMIGCGGIGGWLAQNLAKMLGDADSLTLIDKDKIEDHNLDRQLFEPRAVGSVKCMVLGRTIHARCTTVPKASFLGDEGRGAVTRFDPSSWVFVAADNHPARRTALRMCDASNSHCVIAANEMTDAEAYYYSPAWQDTGLDPRKYYPELLTGTFGDPLSPPCTGDVLQTAPQLALANMSAANYAMWLWWFWAQVAPTLKMDEARAVAPVHVTSTAGRLNVRTYAELGGI